jgi:hypothetical protein
VLAFDDAPARDPMGRPLAYDLDPRSGRAYVPGQNPGAKDKIADYPTGEGPGNRRSADIRAGVGRSEGAHANSRIPVAIAFGAGRLIWVDEEELFTWGISTPQVERRTLVSFTLIPGKDALLAQGWNAHLKTEQGLVRYDGLTGALSLITQERFNALSAWQGRTVAAYGATTVFFQGEIKAQTAQAPFAVEALASSDDLLAAFGSKGETAIWQREAWRLVSEGEPGATRVQSWIVNRHPGARTVSGTISRVTYVDPDLPDSAPLSFPVVTDAPVSIIPGRTGFEQHRLLGFVGGADPHIEIYRPAEAAATSEKRPFGISTLGATAAAVRRGAPDSSIVYAAADTFDGKVHFGFVRDSHLPLPGALILPAGTTHTWLVPHLEGVLILSFDGKRSILNNVPFPE